MDESVKAEPYIIKETAPIDLSKIDFDALKKMFEKGKKNTQAEKLKNALKAKVSAMILLNKERINFAERLQELIDEYNSGALNVEKFFDQLLAFAKELSEEEQRAISENLNEEELAVFDLLKQPNLNNKEKEKVKLAAKELLVSLKAGKLVLDWRKRQETRARVLIAIQKILDESLPRSYTPEVYQQKCNNVYEHIYENYYGEEKVFTIRLSFISVLRKLAKCSTLTFKPFFFKPYSNCVMQPGFEVITFSAPVSLIFLIFLSSIFIESSYLVML